MSARVARDRRFVALRALLRDVMARSRFYRDFYHAAGIDVGEEFLAGLPQGFHELPILETRHLLERADDLRLEGEDYFRVTCSGGTLNAPKILYRTAADWAKSVANMATVLSLAGVRSGDVLLIAQPLDIWGVGYLALDACKLLRCMAVPAGIHVEADQMAHLIERFQVNAAFASPSLWRRVTESAERQSRLRHLRVLVAGEKLYAADREYLADYWRGGVYNLYGSEETDALAAECDAHDGLHLLEHAYLLELMQEDHCLEQTADSTTTGELLVTSCYHRGTPLIRYHLGDIVEISRSHRPCRCGRQGAKLVVIGKSTQCVTLFDATKLYTYQLDAVLEQIIGRGVSYQLLVEDAEDAIVRERVTLLVMAEDVAGIGTERLRAALAASSLDFADTVRSNQVDLRVNASRPPIGATAKGKWQKIVDRRKRPRS
ncbi:MAG: phenylacetate--CoA ligase family protein [Blastocatellia bacterium]